ncbi:hypothetical protein BDA96_08G139700 [Sorghum bicolor]|uniref:Uncharacterized protein n=2 Tax=Sorghum bicolor TaxID=4558 RepID=A0A921U729_SORBI|nr:hypothetical protein BDA96_08G139700 [Sorghum bicolor]KXG23676.1 hypothetical protein SORBI_3008G126300 [Sorghum bicolor]
MNMSDKSIALVLTLLLFVFLVQCRPHEDIHVGTAKRQDASSLRVYGECDQRRFQNGKVVYCCDPKNLFFCYDTFKECRAHCPSSH